MKRGEVWTVSGGGSYTRKPRPAVILQDDSFDGTDSITLCPFTTDMSRVSLFRLPIEANRRSELDTPSHLMVDKITTVSKNRLGERIGRLDGEEISRINQAVIGFLGLPASTKTIQQ